jgi:GAF domain-containing protein
VLQLINPIPTSIHRADVFDADDEMLMRHFGGVASLSIERARLTRSIITRMIRSVELRDRYETKEHASRVADISVELWEAYANRNNTHPKEIERSADRLRIAAMLHDVGKLGVSDVILQKPARLTPEEMAKVREHVIVGARLFDDVVTEFDRHARDVALYHHARWDGSGYPTVADLRQLQKDAPQAAGPMIDPRGENIPLFARIVALADVYDAARLQEGLERGRGTGGDPRGSGPSVRSRTGRTDARCDPSARSTDTYRGCVRRPRPPRACGLRRLPS